MSRFACTVFAAALALSATAASAQIYPLTNGPDGAGSNVPDSVKGFDGINAVAPEREFIYHPERAGSVAAPGAVAVSPGVASADDAGPVPRRAGHHRRRSSPF